MKDIFRLDVTNITDLQFVIALIFGLLTTASIAFFVVKLIRPQANIKELVDRTKSWWVMALIFISATMIITKLAFITIALISFIAFRELYSVLGFRQSDRSAIFWAFLAIPIQYYLAYIGWYGAYIIFIPVVMFLYLPMRLVLQGDTKGIIKSMSSLQWTLMLTVFGISHMALLLSLPEKESFSSGGRGLLLFLVFITEINDVLQYIWGKLLGRHKIVPKVSPNKTWEGFVGGILSTTAIGFGLGFLTPLSTPNVVLVTFIVALSGFFGDIMMSAVKRDIGVKDMGNMIPGHGGVLDRIDSLAYTAPIFFHLVYYLAY